MFSGGYRLPIAAIHGKRKSVNTEVLKYGEYIFVVEYWGMPLLFDRSLEDTKQDPVYFFSEVQGEDDHPDFHRTRAD